jgi:hypothetical protein
MAALVDFLKQLLSAGEVVFRERPLPNQAELPAALGVLRRTHAQDILEIAGAPLDFRPRPALATAELVRQACWFLVHRGEPPKEVQRRLTLEPPATAADHLSADLVLRYLPHLYRRARALAPDDGLTLRLAEVLRQWPLSGVLSDVPEAPLTPLDFGAHPGLLLLYAERLVRNEKPEWLPAGPGADYVELVQRDRSAGGAPPVSSVQASRLNYGRREEQ